MKKIKVFYRDESASYPGKYLIKADLDAFHLKYAEGSYNVIQARLMGLTYAQYLRMCRDCFGAEIIGKNSNYPVAYFMRGEQLEMLLAQLNARANLVLWEREHPDFEAHASYVKEKNPEFYEEIIKTIK
jgi:hypothetical protein